MMPLFILFDFLNSLSHSQLVLVGLVPLFLVIANFVMNWLLSRKETVGYVCNGSFFMAWYFVIYLGSVFAQYSVKWMPWLGIGKSLFDSTMKDGKVVEPDILWYLMYITIAYFICYFFIAFRPVTAEQLQEARANKKIVFELSTTNLSNAMKTSFYNVATLLWGVIYGTVAGLLYSIGLLLCGFVGALILGIILLPIAGAVFIFLTMFLMFASIVIMWFLCAWKFLKNAGIIIVGPAKAGYKIPDVEKL